LKEIEVLFKEWVKENNLNISYEGPFFAPLSFIRGKNRVQILLKDFQIKKKLLNLKERAEKKGIKLSIEIDPKEIR
ncbi:MAG: hypothetical protein GXO21_07690, partial [Aquificae bacterium]|nr:hypothetical protein [Aquificota bacterium]